MNKVWIGVVIIAIVGVILWARSGNEAQEAQLLPPDSTTIAGPQEPVPTGTYDAKPPLSKNRIILRNNMKIEVTKEGSGEDIKNDQIAVVSYVGKLENGTIFDASEKHGDGTFSFQLGAGDVIKGWDEGVRGMKVGESRILTIPGDMAYGPNGIPGVIPPNATLVFDVSLLDIK